TATIAQTLGVKEVAGQALPDTVRDYLDGKQMLLVLDNFEQVARAAPLVDTLLKSASKLKVLVTSRAGLRLYGEREFAVPALDLLDLGHLPPVERLGDYEAVRLFVERAQD